MTVLQNSHKVSPSPEHILWNDRMARKYNPDLYHQHQNPLIRWIESKRVTEVIRALRPEKDDRILEVGCGAGNILEKMPQGLLFGMDLSPFILARASKKLGNRAKLARGAGETLPYQDASFSKVYCSEVLEHVTDPSRLVEEMIRVLVPGGTLALSVPNESLIDRLKSLALGVRGYKRLFQSDAYASPVENEWHLHRFDKKLLKRLVAPWVELKNIRRIPFLFCPLRYVAFLEKPLDGEI